VAAPGRPLSDDDCRPVRPADGQPSSLADLDAFWQRTIIGWHTVYFGLLALLALMIGSSDELSSGERLLSLVVIGVLTLTYLLAGRRVLGDEAPAAWPLKAVQLLVTWAGFYVLIGAGVEQAYILMFALIPHLWAFLSTRLAVAATFVFFTGVAVAEVTSNGWSAESVVGVLPQFVLQAGLSLLLGLFTSGVVRQAESRAALIDELERTRAELAETEHARGVLAERERLAHEIHDTLAQGFTSVLTLAQAVEATLERDPAAARERLALLESTARDNLAEARALVNALAPAGLQDASLPEAVERVAARFARETGVDVQVDVEGEPRPLPPAAEVVLLRTAQEALANIGKHADARAVRVALRFRPGPATAATVAATVAIMDDGRGFDVNAAGGDGFGLRGMRSRVEQIGGTLEVKSAPGLGTTVRATIG
jgi:signal transduction histidine kinase